MEKVLTIAGFDPSAGAGILADIKTFETHGVYGFGVCTAVTVQNEYSFEDAGWLDTDHVIRQLECLYAEHRFEVAKIGLIRDLVSLEQIIGSLVKNNPGIRIVWDPVLKSSSGFSFHESLRGELLDSILSNIFLVTPNFMEADALAITDGVRCNAFVKGGHKDSDDSDDILYMNNGQTLVFPGTRIKDASKHGSGCVLSSAIAACLANAQSLPEACQYAKDYITQFLVSTNTPLGIHKMNYEKA